MQRLAKIAESYAEADLAEKRVSRTPSSEPMRAEPPDVPYFPEMAELPPPAAYIEIEDEDELIPLQDSVNWKTTYKCKSNINIRGERQLKKYTRSEYTGEYARLECGKREKNFLTKILFVKLKINIIALLDLIRGTPTAHERREC